MFARYTCLALSALPALAQVLYGTLTGTVEDASGAIVPGAKVIASAPSIGAAREAITNSSGSYTLTNLPPAVYSVEITASGFRTVTRKGIEVSINTVSRADAQLQVGDVADRVNVEANAVTRRVDKKATRQP